MSAIIQRDARAPSCATSKTGRSGSSTSANCAFDLGRRENNKKLLVAVYPRMITLVSYRSALNCSSIVDRSDVDKSRKPWSLFDTYKVDSYFHLISYAIRPLQTPRSIQLCYYINKFTAKKVYIFFEDTLYKYIK